MNYKVLSALIIFIIYCLISKKIYISYFRSLCRLKNSNEFKLLSKEKQREEISYYQKTIMPIFITLFISMVVLIVYIILFN